MKYLWVGLGGAAGALSRYGVGLLLAGAGETFPWTTLGINLTGSFVLGLLFSIAMERNLLPVAWRAPLMVGFVGSYTTFSTWAVDTDLFLQRGDFVSATLNVVLSVSVGLPSVWAGLAAGRRKAIGRGARELTK